MNDKSRKIIVLTLGILIFLFFIPWYSSRMGTGIDSVNYISGQSVSYYASKFETIANASGKQNFLVGIGLASMKYIYVIPALALICVLMNIAKLPYARAVTIFTFAMHILIFLVTHLMPDNVREMVQALFVETPTLWLILTASLIGLITAIVSYFSPEHRAEMKQRKPWRYAKEDAAPTRAAKNNASQTKRKTAAKK